MKYYQYTLSNRLWKLSLKGLGTPSFSNPSHTRVSFPSNPLPPIILTEMIQEEDNNNWKKY